MKKSSEYGVAESIGAPGTEEEYYERVKTPEEIAAEREKRRDRMSRIGRIFTGRNKE
jgi:hypothetical protein